MNYKETKVFKNLIFLQRYLEGDLEKFKKLCNEAEDEERKINALIENNKINNISTTETTFAPESFEFFWGKGIIARSTIPHTLALFATIDLLGYLLRKEYNYRETKKNLKSFFNNLPKRIDKLEENVLIRIYRNSMAHNFLPALNIAIAYRSEYPENKLFLKINNRLTLNVKCFKIIVAKRLDEIINDESLYPNMDKQYGILIMQLKKDYKKDIDKLIAKL